MSSVDVDACMEHGTWYDRGELAVVRDALRERRTTAERDFDSRHAGLELARAPTHRARAPSTGGAQFGHGTDPGARRAIDKLAHAEEQRLRRHNSWYNRAMIRADQVEAVDDLARGNVAGAALDLLDLLSRW